MNYEDRIVCFLDILGFKNHISTSILENGEDDEMKINVIADAFAQVRSELDIDYPELRMESQITQFSDSIVLSFRSKIESGVYYAINDILRVIMIFVKNGILCRGGIAHGKLIHTDELLFGPAMIAAYKLESEKAKYPRVILDETIINAALDAPGRHHLKKHEFKSVMSLLKKDEDNFYYIDYIVSSCNEFNDKEYDYYGYLCKLREIINEGIKINNNEVKEKYIWLAKKFNFCLIQNKDDIKKSDFEDEIKNAYLKIQLIKI